MQKWKGERIEIGIGYDSNQNYWNWNSWVGIINWFRGDCLAAKHEYGIGKTEFQLGETASYRKTRRKIPRLSHPLVKTILEKLEAD